MWPRGHACELSHTWWEVIQWELFLEAKDTASCTRPWVTAFSSLWPHHHLPQSHCLHFSFRFLTFHFSQLLPLSRLNYSMNESTKLSRQFHSLCTCECRGRCIYAHMGPKRTPQMTSFFTHTWATQQTHPYESHIGIFLTQWAEPQVLWISNSSLH